MSFTKRASCTWLRLSVMMACGWLAFGCRIALKPPGASAATVVLKDGRRVHGWLVRDDVRAVVLRQATLQGTARLHRWPRDQIELVLHNVDVSRLEQLSPEQPQAYLEYAEELSAKRADPEARATARQLFGVAAHLDPARLGRPAMLGLASLSASREQRRACLAMAYLLDPQHDRRLLRGGEYLAGAVSEQQELAQALARLRMGDAQQATQWLELHDQRDWSPWIGRVLPPPELLSLAAPSDAGRGFEATDCVWCGDKVQLPNGAECMHCAALRMPSFPSGQRVGGRLSEGDLRRLVAAQLRLVYGESVNRTPRGWGEAWNQGSDAPVGWLTVESVSGLDPCACLFRKGAWQRP